MGRGTSTFFATFTQSLYIFLLASIILRAKVLFKFSDVCLNGNQENTIMSIRGVNLKVKDLSKLLVFKEFLSFPIL